MEKRKDSNNKLSKLYKKFLSRRYGKPFSSSARKVERWVRVTQGEKVLLSNKELIVRDKWLDIVTMFYQKVIEQGIQAPGRFELLYLGYMQIVQIDSITGKPRHIPNENGEFEEVIEDYFTKYTKYKTLFSIKKSKLRIPLRDFISSGVHEISNKRIVKQAYKLHPNGKFYRSNIK